MDEPRDEGAEPDEFDLDVQIHPPAGTTAQDSGVAAKAPSDFGCPTDVCQTGPGDWRGGLPGDCIPTDQDCGVDQTIAGCQPITAEDCTSGDPCLTQLECGPTSQQGCGATQESCHTQEYCPTREDCPHVTEVNCRFRE